jgi:hypothetical protein
MHSSLWHESGAHRSGVDRLLADIIVQPANDPSGIELLRGEWRTQRMTEKMRTAPLARSRVSRLSELEAEIARLKGVPA